MNLNLYFRVNFFLRNISGMIKIVYNPLPKNAKIKNTTRVLIFDKSCWYWIIPLIVLWFCIIQGKRKCVQEQALEVVKDFVVLSHEFMLSLQDKEYPLSIFFLFLNICTCLKVFLRLKAFQLLSSSNSFPHF